MSAIAPLCYGEKLYKPRVTSRQVILFKLDVLLNGLLSTYLVTVHRRAGTETYPRG